MAVAYHTAKVKLDEIAARIERNSTRLSAAKTSIETAVADLHQMQTDYGQLVTQISQMAQANPADPAWQIAQAEMSKLVAEFQAALQDAEAKLSAFEGA